MRKTIKIVALILALICIGTSCAACGKKSTDSIDGTNINTGANLIIPSLNKSENIGVGARIYVYGKSFGEVTPDFTVDKTTTSTQLFLVTLKTVYAPGSEENPDRFFFRYAEIEETNCLKIGLNKLFGYTPYELHISITLPEKIKKVTLTCREDYVLQSKSGAVIENFGNISEDQKTFSFVGEENGGVWGTENDYVSLGVLRIYF